MTTRKRARAEIMLNQKLRSVMVMQPDPITLQLIAAQGAVELRRRKWSFRPLLATGGCDWIIALTVDISAIERLRNTPAAIVVNAYHSCLG
jgi:hypothetical protein